MISPVKCWASAALPPLPKVYRMPRSANASHSTFPTSRRAGSSFSPCSATWMCASSCSRIHSATGASLVGSGARTGELIETVEGHSAGADDADGIAKAREHHGRCSGGGRHGVGGDTGTDGHQQRIPGAGHAAAEHDEV